MNSLQSLSGKVRALTQRQSGRRVLKAVRSFFIAVVAAWLVYRLSDIGWAEVWASRPRTAWFYVIWFGLYIQLPLVEALIYRNVWGLSFREVLPPILRKRALNQDIVSYSGEAYFFMWARKRLDMSGRRIAGTLKDNAIVSSLASWCASILLIGVFLYSGQIVLTDLIGNQDPVYVTAGVAIAGAVVALGARFRRTIFSQPLRVVAALFATYLSRFVLIGYVLQILQWWVVLPEAPLSVWATMLAVMTIVNRLPLIPAKDLVGIGAVLGMTELLAASHATIAAMLLMRSALDKLANLGLFAGMHLFDRKTPVTVDEPKSLPSIERTEPMFAEQ